MTNTIQLTKEKVDMEHWLAVAEKNWSNCGGRSEEADKNGHFSPKVAEAIVEGGINKLMRPRTIWRYIYRCTNHSTKIVRKVASHSMAAAWLTKLLCDP